MKNQWKVTAVAALCLLAAGCTSVSLAPIEDRSSGSGQAAPSAESGSGVEVTPVPDSYTAAPGAAPVSALPQAISTTPLAQGAAPVDGGKTHTVVQGDTVYNISARYGVHPADLCRLNNIPDSAQISVGQVLRIPANSTNAPSGAAPAPSPVAVGAAASTGADAPTIATGTTIDASAAPQPAQPLSTSSGQAVTIENAPAVAAAPAASSQALTPAQRVQQAQADINASANAPTPSTTPTTVAPAAPAAAAPIVAPAAAAAPAPSAAPAATIGGAQVQWPAKGEVISTFAQNKMGIDIKGTMGEPIVAALDGTVQYVGSNTKGYGLFLIVRHDVRMPGNAMPLITVYGNTSKILVKINDRVKAGQTIALMGNSDSDVPKVRFELRQGKPLDPQLYLK